MPEQFSLVRQAWVPVALDDGRRVFVRPCDISEPVDGRTILRVATGRPDCDIALTEFLIGLLAVAIEGTDRHTWPKLYRTPPSRTELEKAFAPLEPAMMFDGEGPRFFQDLEPLAQDIWQVEELFIDTTAEHFVKPGRIKVLSRTGAAIALLTLQTSAPEGGRGHVTSFRGGGPLTTLVLPGRLDTAVPISLWQLLWANVPSGRSLGDEPLHKVFPWLVETRRNDLQIKTTPQDVHLAQAFFGLPRRIRLLFSENASKQPCDLTGLLDERTVREFAARPGGTKYEYWDRAHPLSPYRKKSKNDAGYSAAHVYSSRVGYRDWIGLVIADGDKLTVPAQSVDEFRTRSHGLEHLERHRSQLLTAAYVMKQNKPLDFAEALMPLVVTGSDKGDEQVKEMARRFILAADIVSGQLVSCVRRALFGEKGKAERDSTALEPVRSRFWADTEQAFYRALRDAAGTLVSPDGQVKDEPADAKQASGEAWKEVLRRYALRIFDDAVPIEDAESDRIKDVIAGRKMLAMALEGYGPVGKKLFGELQLPERDAKAMRGRKAA